MSYLQKLKEDLSDLKLDCEYWDVRVEDCFETNIEMLNGEVIACTSSPSLGAFIRVRKKGFWIYESTTELSTLRKTLERLSQQTVQEVSYKKYHPEKHPPFRAIRSFEDRFSAVSLDQKLELVKKYSQILRSNHKAVSAQVRYQDIYKVKSFLSSSGNEFEFDFNQGGFRCAYTLKSDENLFEDYVRLYGSKFSDMMGQESVFEAALVESEKFLTAPAIKPGKYRVLLDQEVAGVFTHESFGHKSEADFMIGNSNALEEWKIGKKIASDCLTIVDYGGHQNTSGYCPVDDDGTPARKNDLIRNGVLAGRLHSIETATELDEKPTGNSRAINFEWEPIVRMTSTYIEPGSEPVQSLLKKCEGALLVEGVRHGSGLSTFTIAPVRGYVIGKNGERKPVRLAVISGSVFETLKNIEAVSSDFHLHSLAIGGCGKMDQHPLPVADGGPYVLVKEMQVS